MQSNVVTTECVRYQYEDNITIHGYKHPSLSENWFRNIVNIVCFDWEQVQYFGQFDKTELISAFLFDKYIVSYLKYTYPHCSCVDIF